MIAFAAASDTWGISGPEFLALYVVLAVMAAIGTLLVRGQLRRGGTTLPISHLDSQPDDIAYLHGGPDLTVLTALTAMRAEGRITTSGRSCVQAVGSLSCVRAVGSLDPGVGDLQRAIHRSARHSVPRKTLPGQPAVREALARIERRLADMGLLLTAEQRRRIRQASWMLWAVLALGAVRAVAGYSAGRPIGFLLTTLVAVGLGALVLTCRAPRRTDRGDAELKRLRSTHASLAPRLRPDQGVYGPTGAAIGVAVFGAGALWAADPALATELGTQRPATSSGGGGSDGGGGCGGCGGCGG